jgi:hypothetical protein
MQVFDRYAADFVAVFDQKNVHGDGRVTYEPLGDVLRPV